MGLVDADPFGIDILATYKFGSKAMASEHPNMTVKSLKWLGLHLSDFSGVLCNPMPLNGADMKKLDEMCSREYFSNINGSCAWKLELCNMKSKQVKAEIEILAEIYTDFGATLRDKILQQQWI